MGQGDVRHRSNDLALSDQRAPASMAIASTRGGGQGHMQQGVQSGEGRASRGKTRYLREVVEPSYSTGVLEPPSHACWELAL